MGAMLALNAMPAIGEDALGTLFYTPKEREQLERQRRGESPESAVTAPREPVLTGYVKRSDGKSTVFLDRRPYRVRSEKVQKALTPKMVERYEPPPPPPEAANESARPESDAPAPAAAPAAPGKRANDS